MMRQVVGLLASVRRASWRRAIGLGMAGLIGTTAITRADESELDVGRSGSGQLKVEIGFGGPLKLPVSVFPGLPGYATGELGFHSAPFDEPTNDFFQPSPSADLQFILLAKDSGMEILNDHGSAYMRVGETFFLGSPIFDVHPVWDLVAGTPGETYSVTLQLTDQNGVYSNSDPFVLSFTPDPPVMLITPAGPGFATVSWSPATSGFVLQVASELSAFAWTNSPSGSTNPVTLPVTVGAAFYRVSR